jgi:signal transduction histidine kinase
VTDLTRPLFRRLFARLLPSSLFGRIVLLLTVGIVGAQIIGASIHLSERFRLLSTTISGEFAQQIAAVYRTINNQPESARVSLTASLSRPHMQLAIMPAVTQAMSSEDKQTADANLPKSELSFEDKLVQALGPNIRARLLQVPEADNFKFDVVLELSNGQWLRVTGAPPPEVFGQPWHPIIGLSFMLLVIVLLVVVVARITVRPLTRLAQAANDVAQNLKHPPLEENGPSEVREAARAFNAMQKHIREGIEERERFLAAVSHDLKTPVTRLRLRAEMLTDARIRDDIENDVNELQQLIDDALDFLRGRAVDEPVQPIDLVALVESVADDFGHKGEVAVSAPKTLRFIGKPIALQRALRNLVDNAIKYGQRARIGLQQDQSFVVITVDDDGNGIPTEQLEAVFEPFFRVESSRSRETGGTGLGLAIVRLVAHNHGGTVQLTNRSEGGLQAEMVLPIT